MKKNTYEVRVSGEVRKYEEGTTYEMIAKDVQSQYENPIVLSSHT